MGGGKKYNGRANGYIDRAIVKVQHRRKNRRKFDNDSDSEKLNIRFVNPKMSFGLLSRSEQEEMEKNHEENRDMLKIPRDPRWTLNTKVTDLQRAENESFLEWSRSLALLQEDKGIILTPYEKNLELWRHLWRVVERSDVVVQIVDARNPLLFRNCDLEKYVKEMNPNKMNMILMNKSDLLTDGQRKHWAKYFECKGIRTAFFSAMLAAEEFKSLAKFKKSSTEVEEDTSEEDGESCTQDKEGSTQDKKGCTKDDESCSESDENEAEQHKEDKTTATSTSQVLQELVKKLQKDNERLEKKLYNLQQELLGKSAPTNGCKNNPNILSKMELITFFKNIYTGRTYIADVTTIGLVGYPNVGKSSIVNALMTKKKVSVSATLRKTKHFQTLYLDTDMLLYDCPSLVMPNFVLTKADMILNGILPINKIRDHVPAVNLLCMRIPRHILEDKYGIVIAKPLEGEDPNRPPYAEELLLAYGYNRGFITARGQPDQSRAARRLCKDYVKGKLLYCFAPPTVAQDGYHTFPEKICKSSTAVPGLKSQRSFKCEKLCKKIAPLDQT